MARRRTDTLNVWPAFTDTMLAFVLVLVLMVSYQVARSIQIGPGDETPPGVIERRENQARVDSVINDFKERGYDIEVDTNGVIQDLSFGSDVTFQSGDDALSSQGTQLLDDLAREITGQGRNAEQINMLMEIQVAGHTDDVPINNYKFQSNWELSTARATRVVESLIASGVNPNEIAMSATGYGEYSPLVSNATTPSEKKANRRIEMRLIYTNTLMVERQ